MLSRILSRDLWSGIMFAAFSVAFLHLGRDLTMGAASRMGSGYFPRLLALILLGLGIIIAVLALFKPNEPIDRGQWKPISLITLAIISFAVLFERTGMLPAITVLVLLATIGGGEFRLIEALSACVGLSIFCVVVFKFILGMNFPIIGGAW